MMNPRINYEMTEKDLKELMDACRPTPVMFLSGGQSMFGSPQENANRAWAKLGKKMGFDSMTVMPGKEPRFFTAVPLETLEQKELRLKKEEEKKRQQEIESLRKTIATAQERIDVLERREAV